MKRGCNVQCTKNNVQCVPCKHFLWCSTLNFSNICSAVKPPTKHQHCTHHCKWLPGLAEWNIYHTDPQLSHVPFCLFWDEAKGSDWWGTGFAKQRLCEISLIGQVQSMASCDLWQRWDFGDFGLGAWGWMSARLWVCFVLLWVPVPKSIAIGEMNKIEDYDWLQGKLDSSAAEGCHGCQVPVGLHCKSTH